MSDVLWIGQIEFHMQGDEVRVRDEVALNNIGGMTYRALYEVRRSGEKSPPTSPFLFASHPLIFFEPRF